MINDYKAPVFEVKVSKNIVLYDQDEDLLKLENETISIDGVNGSEIVLGFMLALFFIFKKPSKSELKKFKSKNQDKVNWSRMGF